MERGRGEEGGGGGVRGMEGGSVVSGEWWGVGGCWGEGAAGESGPAATL